jgi:glycosyltransferase involved in cell wall biosynthesis
MPMSMPGSTPRVTVFVQAYNVASYVGECLESILSQRHAPAFDVLVIDDASSDATPDVVARYASARVRVVTHEKNVGAIDTANEGYAACRSEFVIRIDADDRLRPEFLARAVDALDRHPECVLAYADIAMIDPAGRVTSAAGNVARGGRPEVADELLPLLLDNYIPAPTTLVRRAALLPFLPIPSHFRFLDWYLTTGLAERSPFVFLPEVLADYRIHGANMHRVMVMDRTGEATSQEVLERVFATPLRAVEKRSWRRRVFAQHYVTYADKYFGAGMTSDARRCYWRAIGLDPSRVLVPGIARRAMGSLVGRRAYDATKRLVTGRMS